MCGIAGIFGKGGIDEQSVARMIGPIAHRGSDDQGIWIDAEAGIGLGHRRLAIVDLSPAGHQPMHSADGRFVLTYNGEIYNHAELRARARGGAVRPRQAAGAAIRIPRCCSKAIAAWGLDETLRQASACSPSRCGTGRNARSPGPRPLWREAALLRLGGQGLRLRLGVKGAPAHPRFDDEIDRRALGLFAARTYIPAPLSIYQRVFKLEPGCVLTIDLDAASRPLDDAAAGRKRPAGLRLEPLLVVPRRRPPGPRATRSATRRRRWRSSSEALAHGDPRPVDGRRAGRRFPVGRHRQFDDLSRSTRNIRRPGPDLLDRLRGGRVQRSRRRSARRRASRAPSTSERLRHRPRGARRHPAAARDVRRAVRRLLANPDPLVSRFAREQVTVALTGDGGDELFAGYNRHFAAPQLWQQLRSCRGRCGRRPGLPLSRLPAQFWSGVGGHAARAATSRISAASSRRRLRLAASADSFDELYSQLPRRMEQRAIAGPRRPTPTTGFDLDLGDGAPDAVRMMYCDAVSYLPDDILAKVDRASMAVSLETRVPFLDHRVAELAARIPLDLKVRGGRGKHILRKLLHQLVPRELIERPKAGFASRSASGSRARCGRGRKICSIRAAMRAKACSIPTSFSAAGATI